MSPHMDHDVPKTPQEWLDESRRALEELYPEQDRVNAAARLSVTRSNFGGAIRQCQTAGMTPYEIQQVIGINDVTYSYLLATWGLDT